MLVFLMRNITQKDTAISQTVLDQWEAESAKVNSNTYIRTYIDEYDYTIVEEWSMRSTFEYDEYDRVSVEKVEIIDFNGNTSVNYIDYFYEGTSNVVVRTEERYE